MGEEERDDGGVGVGRGRDEGVVVSVSRIDRGMGEEERDNSRVAVGRGVADGVVGGG